MKPMHTGTPLVWQCALALSLLQGCSTIFDAPQGSKDMTEAVPESVRVSLGAMARGQVDASMAEAIGLPSVGPDGLADLTQEAGQAVLAAGASAQQRAKQALARNKVKVVSEPGALQPTMYFEPINTVMPQFVILDARRADIWLNGKHIAIPDGSASHAFLIAPGEHRLKVRYPGSTHQPFEADLKISQRERVTVQLTPAASTPDAKTTSKPKKQ